ncbi:hypothetical protein BELL_1129g00020 [Botrytis elliptica]|uniref:Uncharacterized protein n=1 Tax=Botrytis elliptica TaxID=278938 RepID=A0A4Z1ILE9_9HELO|nr:hypothetical protein BELL_1129g00020 [Botrytis elliptica]
MAETNISDWKSFFLYVLQTLYNKVLQNATPNDVKNFLQQILRIPPSIWQFIVLFLFFCLVIWIVLKSIAVIGTFASKVIQPISIPESLKVLCTSASEIAKHVCILIGVVVLVIGVVVLVIGVVVLVIDAQFSKNRFRKNSKFLFYALRDFRAVNASTFDK